MTNAARLLDAHPRLPDIDTTLQGDVIEVLNECSRVCRQAADACLHEEDGGLQRCISLQLDCADICTAAVGVVTRLSDLETVAALAEATRAAMLACAEECHQHSGRLVPCAICVEVCERAEALLIRLLGTIAGRAATGSTPAAR